MINSLSPETISEQTQPDSPQGLALSTYTQWLIEVQNQPPWRAKADKEMDYVDGNQLNSEILEKQRQLGIPPAIEPLIGPAMDAVWGFEAKTRTDWRVVPDRDREGDDVAAALNYKLNQAERQSGADRACSEAFKGQSAVGMGWVEVARESDPFKYAYRCKSVHRNEIFWDFLSKEPDLSDARYLIRRRWTDVAQVKLKWPEQTALIDVAGNGRWTDQLSSIIEGGTTTGLAQAWDDQRGWSIEEQEWRDVHRGRVCLFEVWYRRWESVVVMFLPDGRVLEYDATNPVHVASVAAGIAKVAKHAIARVYVSFWLGPHKLSEGPSPYQHKHFPYVAFWGKREDRTGVPYGAVRGMIFLQDNINSAISKIRWGLSAARTERTKGAVAMTDEAFRQMIARPDADVILDADAMAKTGARFEVKRDFQLNDQQYKMLGDSRTGIQRASGITAAFQGQQGSATSGVQESTQIEQTTQQLADTMDNFKFSRTRVGQLLMSLIVEDLAGKPETVVVRGVPPMPDKIVQLNQPNTDQLTGVKYLTNDVERTLMMVDLSDVPSTPSFRAQQLQAMSEAFKAMPPQFQAVALPHLLSLMDVPNKDEIVKAIQAAQQQETPEQIQKRIDEAVQQALANNMRDLKTQELQLKYDPERTKAEIGKLVSETVKNTITSFYAAMQAGEVLTAVPAVAPVADNLMRAGGYEEPTPAGVAPGFIAPQQPAPGVGVSPVKDHRTGMQFTPGAPGAAAPAAAAPGQQVAAAAGAQQLARTNTDPMTPAHPASAFDGADGGIETQRATDNLHGTPR